SPRVADYSPTPIGAVTLLAAAAVRDITPPSGAAMSGYAARTGPARGTHDPLTLRALVVGRTALVTAVVVGLDPSTCRRIRQRCAGLAEVVVHATHTHSGPVSMPGRLGGDCDLRWLQSVEDAAVDAVREA